MILIMFSAAALATRPVGPPEVAPVARSPRQQIFLLLAVIGAIALVGGGSRFLLEKPWLFDDYLAGYNSVDVRNTAQQYGLRTACGLAGHGIYPDLFGGVGDWTFDDFNESNVAHAFVTGCVDKRRGVPADVWSAAVGSD